jgi:hypothetical protein
MSGPNHTACRAALAGHELALGIDDAGGMTAPGLVLYLALPAVQPALGEPTSVMARPRRSPQPNIDGANWEHEEEFRKLWSGTAR